MLLLRAAQNKKNPILLVRSQVFPESRSESLGEVPDPSQDSMQGSGPAMASRLQVGALVQAMAK